MACVAVCHLVSQSPKINYFPMQRHTLIQNAGTTLIACAMLFILFKAILMNYYHLSGKLKVFLFSLKNISKPQMSGIQNVGMRSYIRRSNLVNKLFYSATAAILLFYIVINAALRH